MDIGINLVESYLRLNGYLTLSEFEVQRKARDGAFRTITDIDIMAVRMPGPVFLGDPHEHPDCQVLLINDPELRLEPDCVDVIVGEVKQGKAEFNEGIRDHGVLHSMLRRVEWLYAGDTESVADGLGAELTHYTAARGGGRVRTRLVAFGRSPVTNLNTMSLSHMIETLLRFFDDHEEAFKPIQFRDPAPAFLRLLLKAGFDVTKG